MYSKIYIKMTLLQGNIPNNIRIIKIIFLFDSEKIYALLFDNQTWNLSYFPYLSDTSISFKV